MDQNARSFSFPATVTRPELLSGEAGAEPDDRKLRRLLYELTALAERVEDMRAAFAARLGISKPQYNILLHLAQHQGVRGRSVVEVAEALRVTGAHVTKEVRSLIDLDLLAKTANPDDGRSVLLCLTPRAEQAVEALAPVLRRVNDSLFASLSAEGFAGLSTQISDVLEDADRTLRKLPYYLEDT